MQVHHFNDFWIIGIYGPIVIITISQCRPPRNTVYNNIYTYVFTVKGSIFTGSYIMDQGTSSDHQALVFPSF